MNGEEYHVCNSHLKAPTSGLRYRAKKDLADTSLLDQADSIAKWGSTVQGKDEGDGWLRCAGDRLLPFKKDGKEVLVSMAEAAPHLWHIDNSKLGAKTDGLGYRVATNLELKMEATPGALAKWGDTVRGTPSENGEWLCVGKHFLPFKIEGHDVIIKKADAQRGGLHAGHAPAQGAHAPLHSRAHPPHGAHAPSHSHPPYGHQGHSPAHSSHGAHATSGHPPAHSSHGAHAAAGHPPAHSAHGAHAASRSLAAPGHPQGHPGAAPPEGYQPKEFKLSCFRKVFCCGCCCMGSLRKTWDKREAETKKFASMEKFETSALAKSKTKGSKLLSQVEEYHTKIQAIDPNVINELKGHVEASNRKVEACNLENQKLEAQVAKKLEDERQRAHSDELDKMEKLEQRIKQLLLEERQRISELQRGHRHPGEMEAKLAELEKKNSHLEAELHAVRQQEAEVHAQLGPLEEQHRSHAKTKEANTKFLVELERKVREHDALEAAHQELIKSHRELEGQVSVVGERSLQLDQSRQACLVLEERMQGLLAEERQALEIAEARNAEVKILFDNMETLKQQMVIFQEPDQEIQMKLMATEQKHAAINGEISKAQAEITELKRMAEELQEAEFRREEFVKAQIELQEVKNIVANQHAQLQGNSPLSTGGTPGTSPPDSPQPLETMHSNGQAYGVTTPPGESHAVSAAASRIGAPPPAIRGGTRAVPKATRSPGAAYRGRMAPRAPPPPVVQQEGGTSSESVGMEPLGGAPPPPGPYVSSRHLTRTQEQAMLDRLTKPRGRR